MAKDPYRYFRIEAQELLESLDQGLMALEKDPDPELVRRLLRQAHTFKGASRVVKRTDIGDLAHQLEDLLASHRDTPGRVKRETIDRALALLDQMRRLVAGLSKAPPKADDTAPPPALEEDQEAIRVSVRDVDAVLESAFEAHTAGNALAREIEALNQLFIDARDILDDLQGEASHATAGEMARFVDALATVRRTLVARGEQVLAELTELRAAAAELRLVPAQTLMTELERVVRDAARTLDKEVAFSAVGAHTHIDAHVLAGLRKALVHLVRNSVAHGIEARNLRERAGKPQAGCVEIAIERRGQRVAISCRDDGRGIDAVSVRKVAVERGLLSRDVADAMDEAGLFNLLLRGGVSTSRTVTGVSGRGVGLEAVRHVVEKLRGEIHFESHPGAGTTVTLLVPFSLSAVPALAMQVNDEAVLVPLDSVRQALRIAPADISRDETGERLVVDGTVLPFLRLATALRRPRRRQPERQSAVVIEAEGRLAALGADALGEARSVMVRAVPEHAAPDPIISGAALDAEGKPQLVLAPPALVQAAFEPRAVEEEPAPVAPPPLLVVDDSLTTRMLEQSILESAGYEVDLALSAEEALEKVRQRRYGVLIVDVEMPGMDGFELLATMKDDPDLRDIPAILVTSRAAPEDKRRGKEVGAKAYIVKGELDQTVFLETIRRLVG